MMQLVLAVAWTVIYIENGCIKVNVEINVSFCFYLLSLNLVDKCIKVLLVDDFSIYVDRRIKVHLMLDVFITFIQVLENEKGQLYVMIMSIHVLMLLDDQPYYYVLWLFKWYNRSAEAQISRFFIRKTWCILMVYELFIKCRLKSKLLRPNLSI